MRILVVGASGYVGGRLVPMLVKRGDAVTVAGRDPGELAERFPTAEIVPLDLLQPATFAPALRGIEVAYYLAHSMGGGVTGFAERDRAAARSFAAAAARAGVGRIIYLGGLGDDGPGLSHHLASRHEVGAELAGQGVPVTEFRAAIIIGSGSASFEMLRHLTERLPVMITPRWVSTRCQPIAIRDALDYLVAALEHPEVGGIVEIGGPDVLSYGQMMLRYAKLRGLRRLMIPVPVLTPRLSSYWVNLISPVPSNIARPLIEGLRNEVVVRHPERARAFGISPAGYDEALAMALDRSHGNELESTWFDALRRPGGGSLSALGSREGMILDQRSRHVAASPDQTFSAVGQIGGTWGWPYANSLWRARALSDRMVGGVGFRLGRRDANRLRVGDALDFWRVEAVTPGRLLRLRGELKVPGRAWLEFRILPERRGSRLVQTAYFEPKGLAGLAYWYLLYPAHMAIFRGMLRVLAARATALAPDSRAEPAALRP
ncbi:MAG TPA: SDR family oxidoreductase [Candidatus Limnocylindria bacterium]|nr:SDR family oxidoreductase [Candidatus Limnocylindria bacterium]